MSRDATLERRPEDSMETGTGDSPDAPARSREAEKDRQFREEALPHLDAVYRFGLRLSSSESQAEDLVQDTFLRAYRAWDQYTLGTNCKSWLFTICRNLYLRRQHRRSRHEELLRENAPADQALPRRPGPALSAGPPEDPEGAFFHRIVDDTVLEAIDELPEKYRTAVVLSDVEGLSYDEVSEVMDVPLGTVKSRIHRGRQELQETLREYAVETGFLRPDAGTSRSGEAATTRETPARAAPSRNARRLRIP